MRDVLAPERSTESRWQDGRRERKAVTTAKRIVSPIDPQVTGKVLIICPASRMVVNVRSGVSRTSPALVKLDGSELFPTPQLRQGAAW